MKHPAVVLSFLACSALCAQAPTAGPYQPQWDSLIRHQTPAWLIDAKFGIYAHWGVYSVPAYANEWYGKRMYDPDDVRDTYDFHRRTYGAQDKFGYKDLVPMFKAEKFDPDDWAETVRRSGARYAGTAVVHHDGFLLWDSKVSRWNAVQVGPRRNLYGDLVKAMRARGLKIVATEHHMRTFNWYLPNQKVHWEAQRQARFDLFDPNFADLYWNQFTSTKAAFMKAWKAKLLEVIDGYRPDVLWFDGGDFTSPEVAGFVLDTLAHYHNQAAAAGTEVAVLNKFAGTMKFNFPREFGMLTYEAGRDRPVKVDLPWIDDLSVGENSWGYVRDLKVRPARDIILGLIDRVSRGGGLLLSLAPLADGRIPDDQKAVLAEIGDWLRVNGEAIYGTRPWKVHAEGDVNKLIYKKGAHTAWRFDMCTAEDIRFTQKGAALYAMALGWPASAKVVIQTLTRDTAPVSSVSLLGAKAPLKWKQSAEGLSIELPAQPPSRHACAFKIALRGRQ